MEVNSWEVVASAVAGADDTFFALVRFSYHLEALHGETSPSEGFKVFELEVFVDDTKRIVTAMQERSQLAPEDVGAFSTIDRAQVSSAPFPSDRLGPYPAGLDNAKVHAAAEAWCKARCSGNMVEPLCTVLAPSFRLHDAYGLLPVLCDPARMAAGAADACVVDRERVMEIIEASKERYEIDCHSVDCAVSADHNVAFTHWRSQVKNRSSGAKFCVEGIEVDLFDGQGRLTDVFLFRDPMDFERDMLSGNAQQGGAPGVWLIP
ncbi:hypothetical protein Rsub_11421 [Raphidocelis subcapitata]|uniref:Uncharacterized protein n=1 Tax=Raphidocelis subcapitata TaxID=307507 RepID=A0A2V0PHB7_9CHLO|nr:hypothetical protein Rsub_11421 [Raphidocelis subcapitata]|eukprot:GBF99214.1 hypothetical protein Rsub_11421 [Raphidocelis subcapitata]